MKTPDDYRTTHAETYEEPNSIGFTTVPCLTLLEGHPWDEVALAYVHALRPSCIRVTTDCVTLDGRIWRVTVYVTEENVIKSIEQEVEVGLPEGVHHAMALQDALSHGLDSPQVAWHRNEGHMLVGSDGKCCIIDNDGKAIPYPKP